MESSLTVVCPGCGKYGTAGGFEAAIAHTADVCPGSHVIFGVAHSQWCPFPDFSFVSWVHICICQMTAPDVTSKSRVLLF